MGGGGGGGSREEEEEGVGKRRRKKGEQRGKKTCQTSILQDQNRSSNYIAQLNLTAMPPMHVHTCSVSNLSSSWVSSSRSFLWNFFSSCSSCTPSVPPGPQYGEAMPAYPN